jgi:hypothetical protein
MTDREQGQPDELRADGRTRRPYVKPEVERLGTLDELTRGGTTGPDDGVGGAGTTGSLP